jgi:hypothetical protein
MEKFEAGAFRQHLEGDCPNETDQSLAQAKLAKSKKEDPWRV